MAWSSLWRVKTLSGELVKSHGFDLAKIVGFLVVALGLAYGYGELNTKVAHLEKQMQVSRSIDNRLTTLEVEAKHMRNALQRIEKKL